MTNPITVTVTLATTPSLIVFRDGADADWQVPAPTGPGRYEFEVRGPYTVEAVCLETADAVEIVEVSRTTDDPREFAMPCLSMVRATPPFHVTGTSLQFATIALGASQQFALPNMPFDIAVDAGSYDLVARIIDVPGADEIVIRRDLVFTASTMLMPPIDATKEAAPLVEVPLTVTNLQSDEDSGVFAELRTQSTRSRLAVSKYHHSVRVLAPSALRPTDVQSVHAHSSRLLGDGSDAPFHFRTRGVSHLLGQEETPTLTLPGGLDSLDFALMGDRLTAAWATLPEYDTLEFAIGTFEPSLTLHRKLLSVAYVTATGATSATLETNVPGYRMAWKINLIGPYGRLFAATTTDADAMGTTSMLDEDVNAVARTSPVTPRSRGSLFGTSNTPGSP